MDREHEETERIPWSMLAGELERRRPRWILQVVGIVLVVLVVGALAMRARGASNGTVVDLAPVTTEEAEPGTMVGDSSGEPSSEEPPAAPSEPAVAPADPSLYSEADLMAVVPEEDLRLAAARAEWFTVDFFGGVDAGLAPGLPEVHSDAGYSWVEWARASRVAAAGAGRYDVTVVFRTLTEAGAGGFRRLPIRAVIVPVEVDAGGLAVVADLPRPAEVPGGSGAEPVPPVGAVPEDVAAAALQRAGLFGPDAEIVGGSRTLAGWRVIVLAGDASGMRWPLAVEVGD